MGSKHNLVGLVADEWISSVMAQEQPASYALDGTGSALCWLLLLSLCSACLAREDQPHVERSAKGHTDRLGRPVLILRREGDGDQ